MARIIAFVRSILLAVPLLAAAPSTANAVERGDFLLENAKQLGALCGAAADIAAIHMCEGFLVGVHRTLQSIENALGQHFYCIPPGANVTRDSAARDFAAWAATTPAAATMPPVDGALQWASHAYPCH